MRKRILTIMVAIALIFAFTLPATAAWKDMWAYVYTWDGKMNGDGTMKLTRQITNITFCVFVQDQIATVETLYEYNDDTMTSLTNPVTGTNFTSATVCNDMISFRVDPTDATYDRYVDLLVVDQDGGYTAFIEDFDEYTHAIVIDERKNIQHHGSIWFYSTTGAELDTGIDFNDNTIISSVAIEVITLDAGETIDIGILSTGTGGDADGFIDGESLATAGYYDVKWHQDVNSGVSSGATIFYYMETDEMGSLFGVWQAGSGGDTNPTHDGEYFPIDHRVYKGQEQSLTWTITDCSTAWGLIHYYFTQIR